MMIHHNTRQYHTIHVYVDVYGTGFVFHTSNQGNFGCHPLCLAHAVFGLQTVDLCRCSFCGATGEPEVAASYVYSAYVSELESQEAEHGGLGRLDWWTKYKGHPPYYPTFHGKKHGFLFPVDFPHQSNEKMLFRKLPF